MPTGTARPKSETPALFGAHYQRIFHYILSMMNDPSEAEDLTQETFLRAFVHQDSLRAEAAALTWLYRIATNLCLDRLRQRTRRAPLETAADLDELDPADTDQPSLPLVSEQSEMSACVQEYLAGLPDHYRTVILLQDMHGMSGPEIAETLGLPLSTVKIRLHRARRRLRAALDEGCSFSHDERNVLVCEPKP